MKDNHSTEIDQALAEIVEVVNRFASQQDVEEQGGRLVRPTPVSGPNAFLHILYPPAEQTEIDGLAVLVGRQPPPQYGRLLAHFNGLNLYGGMLTIYGIRRHFDRSFDAARWQPYSVELGNLDRTRLAADDFCVGSLGLDRHRIVFRLEHGDFGRLHPESRTYRESWPSLAALLVDETRRLAECFEVTGELKAEQPLQPGKVPAQQFDLSSISRPLPGSGAWWRSQLSRLVGR